MPMFPTRMAARIGVASIRSAPTAASPSLRLSTSPFASSHLTRLQSTGSSVLTARSASPAITSLLHHQFHTARTHSQQKEPESDKKDGPSKEKTAEDDSADPKKEKSEEGEGGEKGEGAEEGKTDNKPPPPPHGDKSPWQVFTETIKAELEQSKEWKEGKQALSSGFDEFAQKESVRKAREMSDAASNKTAAALKSTGEALGKSASWTWDTTLVKGVRKGVTVAGHGIEKATRPVRETEAYKSVRDVIDDGSSSRYGGWIEKEERRRRRKLREEQSGVTVPHDEDPNAGTNVTLHKDSKWKESWRDFRDQSKVIQSLSSFKSTYQESDNPLIITARSITDRFAGFFAENETAAVIKKFREMDPNFRVDPFLEEMREYILPEVLDAYVKGDVEVLKTWLSAAQFSVYSALMKQYTTAGLKSDGRILDIRNVDIANARLLDPGEIPIFLISCRTQEVHVYKNAKTGELMAGMDDNVQQVTYVIGITRNAEDVSNPETRGWRLIELHKSARNYL